MSSTASSNSIAPVESCPVVSSLNGSGAGLTTVLAQLRCIGSAGGTVVVVVVVVAGAAVAGDSASSVVAVTGVADSAVLEESEPEHDATSNVSGTGR